MPLVEEICLVAGEASGDAQGALLVKALKKKLPNVHFWGAVGPLLRQEGVESVVQVEDLAAFGLLEIVTQYPVIAAAYKKLLAAIMRRRPQAVIFIDYPGFNLKLIQDVYLLGITTIYHIPPKAWSHGENRSHILRDYCYLVTSILPFEVEFFKKKKVPIQFIGNPLKDHVDKYISIHGNEKKDHQIGLFPGSRKGEIQRVLPVLIEAFIKLYQIESRVRAHLPIAPTLSSDFVKHIVYASAQSKGFQKEWVDQHIQISFGNSYDVMKSSSYAWVCSGTAVLETAFFNTPMSSFYKLNPITFWIGKKLVKTIKYITLVNLCADKMIVPEFLQDEMTPENLVDHALLMLQNDSARNQMILELDGIKKLFPSNAAENAACAIANCIAKYDLSLPEKFHMRTKSMEKECF